MKSYLYWFYKILDKLLEKKRTILINGFNSRYIDRVNIYNWALKGEVIKERYKIGNLKNSLECSEKK